MVRGTFANIRLRNELVPGVEGGFTVHLPDGERTTIFEASERYRTEGVPLIVIAGKEYGSGSLARLGRQGHAVARRAGGDRGELRAHPSQQPDRDGRAAAGVHRRREAQEPGADGARELLDRGAGGRRQAAPEAQGARRGGRPARASSRCWRGSTRPRKSSTCATAASCRTCCANCSTPERARRIAYGPCRRVSAYLPNRRNEFFWCR